MKTISTVDDLAHNLAILRKYLNSSKESEHSFAQELTRDGLCFVVQMVDGSQFFAPSRFVGYRQNSMAAHRRNKKKDGRVTNPVISKILGSKPEINKELEEQYRSFCARIGVEPRAEGPFGIERKYWVAQTKVKSRRTMTSVAKEFSDEVSRSINDDPEVRRARLRAAPKKPKRVSVSASAFLRNPDVVAEVLLRANGVCEGCNQPAPFVRRSDGSPYLEVHHTIQLAEGGDDTVENASALCPNCHRKAHYA